ncbi:uncharacterized protein LOC141530889 isoform X1 [Cotesia typhae]|uniref:uncharacterized protein LOC141530889 isoform X1 n=2 Tax=Cotesia typhae TaxID=2053667 RepID=UPI003D69756D
MVKSLYIYNETKRKTRIKMYKVIINEQGNGKLPLDGKEVEVNGSEGRIVARKRKRGSIHPQVKSLCTNGTGTWEHREYERSLTTLLASTTYNVTDFDPDMTETSDGYRKLPRKLNNPTSGSNKLLLCRQ